MNPLVSILIPVYNAEKWVVDTCESVINQTWGNIEVIFVDDGSTDNSLDIINSFKSPEVKVLTQENKGASAARNLAYNESKGDYIQFLDADDILDIDKIDIQLQRLMGESHDCIATCSWARFYKDDINTADFKVFNDHKDYEKPVEWILDQFNGKATMPPLSWLIPRRVIESSGLWNEKLSLNDDTEFFVRQLLNSNKIIFCENAKAYYRSGNPSLSSNKDIKAVKSYFKVCEFCEKMILDRECSDRTKLACANMWQFFLYQIYPDHPEILLEAEKEINSLGGSNLKIDERPLIQNMTNIIGWKITKRILITYQKFKNLYLF